jgi:DNA invertase Pin-like site-specific DNA recombinase
VRSTPASRPRRGSNRSSNSLQAQREACEAFIDSQRHEGWVCQRAAYDDGGFSGATMDRPALQQLLADVTAGRVDTIVVYKIDRLTRSLADFAKIVEILDAKGASFVSVTQQFNTTTSMGRLTLNVLLSFAQFEREVIGERIRDKIAASKKKGIWMGGVPPVGYRAQDGAPGSIYHPSGSIDILRLPLFSTLQGRDRATRAMQAENPIVELGHHVRRRRALMLTSRRPAWMRGSISVAAADFHVLARGRTR